MLRSIRKGVANARLVSRNFAAKKQQTTSTQPAKEESGQTETPPEVIPKRAYDAEFTSLFLSAQNKKQTLLADTSSTVCLSKVLVLPFTDSLPMASNLGGLECSSWDHLKRDLEKMSSIVLKKEVDYMSNKTQLFNKYQGTYLSLQKTSGGSDNLKYFLASHYLMERERKPWPTFMELVQSVKAQDWKNKGVQTVLSRFKDEFVISANRGFIMTLGSAANADVIEEIITNLEQSDIDLHSIIGLLNIMEINEKPSISHITALLSRITEIVEKLGNLSNFLAEISYIVAKIQLMMGIQYFNAQSWELRDMTNKLIGQLFLGLEKKLQEDPGLFLLKTSEIVQLIGLSLKYNGEANHEKLFANCLAVIENRPIEYLSREVVSQLLEIAAAGKVKLTPRIAEKLERNCLEHLHRYHPVLINCTPISTAE